MALGSTVPLRFADVSVMESAKPVVATGAAGCGGLGAGGGRDSGGGQQGEDQQ